MSRALAITAARKRFTGGPSIWLRCAGPNRARATDALALEDQAFNCSPKMAHRLMDDRVAVCEVVDQLDLASGPLARRRSTR